MHNGFGMLSVQIVKFPMNPVKITARTLPDYVWNRFSLMTNLSTVRIKFPSSLISLNRDGVIFLIFF